MPEGLEAELYRRAAERCIGRTVAQVDIDERQAAARVIRDALPGVELTAARRIGKLVLLDGRCRESDAPTLGLHFGMTGRLVVDDVAPIERLEYASGRDDPAWDRFVIRFAEGGVLRVNDPRRWATFTLDPDEQRLGPDIFDLEADVLAARLAGRRAALKGVLLDQSVVAGFGNLTVDEVLWHAGIAPTAPAGRLERAAVAGIVDAARRHLPEMLARGGSHRGTIDPEVRAALPPCPRDGLPLRRDSVAGRTTVWCPAHQVVPD